MELLAALGDGGLIKIAIWFIVGFSFGYFVPAPKFISDRFGGKR